ncbi:hypothetical protein CLOM_g15521 [Closterium sp. NIES-68]|nr:hypothetical protein CLOM_g15521 [Closterium sp. NIES-68]GJP85044.1 hypothetical protein CLOP_g15150 [Closterium sp. NIES-67]
MGLRGPTTYDAEPTRRPDMIVNYQAPYNAETPPSLLGTAFVTGADAFYVRSHGPTPVLDDAASYRLQVGGLVPKPLALSLQEIKSMPAETIVATMMCAGNRRTEMSTRRKVKGVGWSQAAIGNATWTGVRLSHVLQLAGVTPRSTRTSAGGKHVEFTSVDICPEEKGGPYKASLPLIHASSPEQDVLLAYKMNGEDLTPDHGFPLRIVVPGVIGARSVKWLDRIDVLSHESQGFFMQRDYKMFPPNIDWHNIEWNTRRPIMDFPIQSAITEPAVGDAVQPGPITIRGYAAVGGGRGIERVEVSTDGGATWQEATRLPHTIDNPSKLGLLQGPAAAGEGGGVYVADAEEEGEGRFKWAWVLWQLNATVSPPCQIVARAVDSSSNTQPEDVESIWNLRGVLNNSWHRVDLKAAAGTDPPAKL